MSLTIDWCDICNDGSLEGDPKMVSCADCGQSFHVYCSTDRAALWADINAAEEDEDNDSIYNQGDCESKYCRKCQGLWEDPKVREFANGYAFALYNAAEPDKDDKKTLKGALLAPLAAWFGEDGEERKLKFALDLTGFDRLDEDACNFLQGHNGDVKLNDIAEWSDEAFAKIAKIRGEITIGLESLTENQWAAVASRGGYETSILNSVEFSKGALKHFAKNEICLYTHNSEIDANTWKALLKGKGSLQFPKVETIDLETAKLLAKTKKRVFLYGLEKPEKEIVELLKSNNECLGIPYWEDTAGEEDTEDREENKETDNESDS